MNKLIQGARRAGPYLLVELILPGGSLIALLMLFAAYRKKLANAVLSNRPKKEFAT